MLKAQMPNIPGAGVVTDTLDFVKNLWGSMSVPGVNLPSMAAPTLSVDELDKKIADLKAVEAWLNVNATMLRGTIQALEVQRGTLATLKAMGTTLANAVKQPGADEKSVLAAAPFASAFFGPAEAAKEKTAEATPPASPAPAKPKRPAAKKADAAKGGAKPAAATVMDASMANPAAWWNLLQDQFKQAVGTAMASTETVAKPAAGAATEITKAVAKTLSRAAAPAPKRAAVKKAAAKRAAKASQPANS